MNYIDDTCNCLVFLAPTHFPNFYKLTILLSNPNLVNKYDSRIFKSNKHELQCVQFLTLISHHVLIVVHFKLAFLPAKSLTLVHVVMGKGGIGVKVTTNTIWCAKRNTSDNVFS